MEKIPASIHESWHPHLQPLFELPEVIQLKSLLSTIKFFPTKEDIFNVFKMPLHEVKVVILGQDPYPRPGQAIGYSFAVSPTTPMPPSLKIIQDEVILKEGFVPQVDAREWRTLSHWRQQGVFLLNTSLTVESNKPQSHTKYWEDFIIGVIRILAEEVKPIWLLWGANARDMGAIIFEYHETGRIKGSIENRTMSASHPANEARGNGGFFGCNHFKKVNDLLTESNKQSINW